MKTESRALWIKVLIGKYEDSEGGFGVVGRKASKWWADVSSLDGGNQVFVPIGLKNQ